MKGKVSIHDFGAEESRQNHDNTVMKLMPNKTFIQSNNQIVQPFQVKSQYQKQYYLGVNQILVYQFKKQKPTFYVPAYLRMKINRVNNINYIQSKAQIQADIRIWLKIKQFPKIVQDQIINQTKLQINGSKIVQFDQIREPLKLDQSQIRNTSKFAVGFLLSQAMELDIQSNPFWSPYELVKLIANIQLKKISLGNGNQQFDKDLKEDSDNQLKTGDFQRYSGASVQFNFLDAHPFLQFAFGSVRHLGSFDIAQSLVDMKFTNDSIQEEDDNIQQQDKDQQQDQHLNLIGNALGLQQKIKKQKLQGGIITPDAYEHGQILIPLYKYPSTTIINVFLPLYMVAIMNFGVFFQLNDMSNRDGSLATFLLAYIAFLPTIRDNLPETPKIVWTEILVYIQIIVSLICFFYSLAVNQTKDHDYIFTWNSNPTFLACLALTLLNMLAVLGMFLIHKIVWQRQYNKLPKGSAKYMNSKTLNTDDNQQWWNKECDAQFEQAIKVGVVKPFIFKKKKKNNNLKSNTIFNAMVANQNSQKSQNALQNPAKIYPSAE